jgi:hypothetical protein
MEDEKKIFDYIYEKVEPELRKNISFSKYDPNGSIKELLYLPIKEYLNTGKYKEFLYSLITNPETTKFLPICLPYRFFKDRSPEALEIINKILTERNIQWKIPPELRLSLNDFNNEHPIYNLAWLVHILCLESSVSYLSYKLKVGFKEIDPKIRESLLLTLYGDIKHENIFEAINDNFDSITPEVLNIIFIESSKNPDLWRDLLNILESHFSKINPPIRETILENILINHKVETYTFYGDKIGEIILSNFNVLPEILRDKLIIQLSKSKKSTNFVKNLLLKKFQISKPTIKNVIDNQLNNRKSYYFLVEHIFKSNNFDEAFKENCISSIIKQNLGRKYLSKTLLFNFENIENTLKHNLFTQLSNFKEGKIYQLKVLYSKFYTLTEKERDTLIDSTIKLNFSSKSLLGIIYNYYDQIPNNLINEVILILLNKEDYKKSIKNYIVKNIEKIDESIIKK